MLHPATELRFVSPLIGVGVFATALIPKGTITWVRCKLDRSFSVEDVRALGPAYEAVIARYAYTDSVGRLVLCWDYGRYMNHSCDPACISPGFDCDVAVRDILPGEELTCDYGMLNPTDALACACASPACRGRCGPGDGVALARSWDLAVASAFAGAANVEQPLLPLMDDSEKVVRALRGEGEVPSTRRHLRYGKEQPLGVQLTRDGGTFRLVASEPLEAGRALLRCEGPDESDGPFAEEERAFALDVGERGLVVPHNEARFIGKSRDPNVVLESDGTVRVTRAVAPGEAIRFPDDLE